MAREIDTIPTPTHVKPIKLIILSAPRNGTLGLYRALKQLGYKPYHMVEALATGESAFKVMVDGTNADLYHDGKPYGREEFDKWFADYDVIIEMPSFMLRSTLKAYPDAKFLLTERDPEKWATSYANTIGAATVGLRRFPMSVFKYFDGKVFQVIRFTGALTNYWTNGFGVSDEGRQALIENYKTYVSDVKRLVPPEQLMVIKLEDGLGWKELCPYLGVPIPDTPWPRLNTTDEFKTLLEPTVMKTVKKGITGIATVLGVAAVGIWYARKGLLGGRA
ncbi:P-loop containing nucleoside triphosphate hydrolase protein [Xylaria intraflava]|nr:P-loop containing nucleoside triphosphate hydrolase protein [Xylaria intraflava]